MEPFSFMPRRILGRCYKKVYTCIGKRAKGGSGMEKERELTEQEERREREHKRKRRVAAGAVALLASGGLIVGGLFNSPAALLDEQDMTPPVILADDDGEDDLDGPGGEGDEDSADEEEEQETEEAAEEEGSGLRRRIQQLPYAVRLLVILPLWCIGWLLLTGAAALWTAVLSPVLGKALGWLLLIGALLGALLLAGKTLFPDLPVKKILNRRNVLGVVVGSLLLGVLDLVLPLFWDGYVKIESIVRGSGILLIFGAVTLRFAARERKRRRALAAAEAEQKEEMEEEEPEEEEPRPLTREEILALADTVSRAR